MEKHHEQTVRADFPISEHGGTLCALWGHGVVTVRPSELAFYIQVGSVAGLGHLTRSSAVAEALKQLGFELKFVLETDEFGRNEAESFGIAPGDATVFDCVIIDAALIPEGDAQYLQRFKHRILISPVCDRADIATEVMVRATSDKLKSVLPSTTAVIENPSFSYTTTRNLQPRVLNFDQIRVGICLSGGEAPLDVNELVTVISEISAVSEIYVLHYQAIDLNSRNGILIVQELYDRKPWTFFSEINVFIGSDGLMISEAAAQGIPSISLTTQDALFKNNHLSLLGCVECLTREPLDYPSLQRSLSDRVTLEEMHEIALQQILPDGAELLAESIHRALNFGGKNGAVRHR